MTWSFQYDQKTKQFQQISLHDCKLTIFYIKMCCFIESQVQLAVKYRDIPLIM